MIQHNNNNATERDRKTGDPFRCHSLAIRSSSFEVLTYLPTYLPNPYIFALPDASSLSLGTYLMRNKVSKF